MREHAIRCAHCKQSHFTVAEVRVCASLSRETRPKRDAPVKLDVALDETYAAMQAEAARQLRDQQRISEAEDGLAYGERMSPRFRQGNGGARY